MSKPDADRTKEMDDIQAEIRKVVERIDASSKKKTKEP